MSTKDKLKFVIITGSDPIYVNTFFKEFLPQLAGSEFDLKMIVDLKPFNDKTRFDLLKRIWNLYGPVDFFRFGMKFSYCKIFKRSLRNISKGFSVRYKVVSNINSKAFLDGLDEMGVDIIVSVAAPQIFKKRILNLTRFGCINIHGGRLPKYRGMLPSFWTIFNREKEGYITIHEMNRNLDDGKIILQKPYPLDKTESMDDVIIKTKKIAANLLLETLDLFQTDQVSYKPNDRESATYFSFPSKSDVKEFRKRGFKLL